MIDISKERAFPLVVAVKDITGRSGKPINLATAHRWCQRGIHGIKLEFIFVGGVKATSFEAIARFFERVTTSRSADTTTVVPRTRRQVERDVERAYATLAKYDI